MKLKRGVRQGDVIFPKLLMLVQALVDCKKGGPRLSRTLQERNGLDRLRVHKHELRLERYLLRNGSPRNRGKEVGRQVYHQT